MLNISFSKPTTRSNTLGLSFVKNKAGYFVVECAIGQSQTKGVEVGDIIVQIGETAINPNMKRMEVGHKFRLNVELLGEKHHDFAVTFARLQTKEEPPVGEWW
jgi:hypothetical protein